MIKKRVTKAESNTKAVTSERAARLYQLIRILSAKPQPRSALTRSLRLDLRGFYRDLELLRSVGIAIPVVDGRYTLVAKLNAVLPLLPFPDPHLSLGEAMQLAKGRTTLHRKLKQQIDQIIKNA